MERLTEQRQNLVMAVARAISRLTAATPALAAALPALELVRETLRIDHLRLLRFTGRDEALVAHCLCATRDPAAPELTLPRHAQRETFAMVTQGFDLRPHIKVLAQGEALSLIAGNAVTESERQLMAMSGIRSLLRVPVIAHEKLWGTLALDSSTRHRLWLDHELIATASLARVIGVLVERDGEAADPPPLAG